MINNPINIIDNVYCKFHCVNNDFVIGAGIGGYNSLSSSDVGKTISYLARNINKNLDSEWEIGIGQVFAVDSFLIVRREKVLSSSNQNETVAFSNLSDPSFCVIPNQYNFHTGFNNIITKNSDFDVDTIKTTYYIDNTLNDVVANLPLAADNQGLIVEFKTIDSNNLVVVYPSVNDSIDGQDHLLLSSAKPYTRLASTGYGWIELVNNMVTIQEDKEPRSSKSIPRRMMPLSIGPQGYPGGDPLSLQFNAISGFDGLSAYYVEPNLLIGGNTVNTALDIIPLSNHSDTIFNNLNGSGNFIVRGLPTKNLHFDPAGKLGINIPSGLQPAAALHINNNGCVDGIRLDNKNSCYPATLTLFHRPSTVPLANSVAAVINLSGKNSVNNQVNYVQLKSKILNSTINSTQGQLVVSLENNGQQNEVMLISPNRFSVAIGNSSIDLSSSGVIISGPIRLSELDLDGGIVVFSGLSSDNSPVTTPTLTATISPTPTITASVTPTPTSTSTPTPTPTPTLAGI
jgi:hypothetical protein